MNNDYSKCPNRELNSIYIERIEFLIYKYGNDSDYSLQKLYHECRCCKYNDTALYHYNNIYKMLVKLNKEHLIPDSIHNMNDELYYDLIDKLYTIELSIDDLIKYFNKSNDGIDNEYKLNKLNKILKEYNLVDNNKEGIMESKINFPIYRKTESIR